MFVALAGLIVCVAHLNLPIQFFVYLREGARVCVNFLAVVSVYLISRFPLARSLDRAIARSIARSLDRSIARSLDRSIARSLARSLDRSIARSLCGPLSAVSPNLGQRPVHIAFLWHS